jgi:predicted RNA polymerase sigma factor
MGEPSSDLTDEFESFARTSLAPLVAVILRVVQDAALAYDLATETLAGAPWRWEWPLAAGDDRFAWLIEVGGTVLAEAAERKCVPSVERRRRTSEPPSLALTIADQQEIARLAEAHLELTPAAHEAAARLARTSPPLHVLREIGLSGLVDAEPLPDRERPRTRPA